MSDPNYAHEFVPNRAGLCKTIISESCCHEPEAAPVHQNWIKQQNVVSKEAIPLLPLMKLLDGRHDEPMQEFVREQRQEAANEMLRSVQASVQSECTGMDIEIGTAIDARVALAVAGAYEAAAQLYQKMWASNSSLLPSDFIRECRALTPADAQKAPDVTYTYIEDHLVGQDSVTEAQAEQDLINASILNRAIACGDVRRELELQVQRLESQQAERMQKLVGLAQTWCTKYENTLNQPTSHGVSDLAKGRADGYSICAAELEAKLREIGGIR